MINFDIPIVLFTFKRYDSLIKIINRISEIKPKKIYILSDGWRNEGEKSEIIKCREIIEKTINWECEIVKKYECENIGVYGNIALGAKWVFAREKVAIFLEDDNLPEITFFQFCAEMLEKYKDEKNILWVCGTNYIQNSEFEYSYFFTKNMLPCGWASWAEKFLELYDGDLINWNDKTKKLIKNDYFYKPLYYQDIYNIQYELDARSRNGRFFSWDYQMSFSMRLHDVYAIVPSVNQIKNIGVDQYSTHGGNSFDDVMVKRFCELKTEPIIFPLKYNENIKIDRDFEKKIAKIILRPDFFSIKSILARIIRNIFNINRSESIRSYFLRSFSNEKK